MHGLFVQILFLSLGTVWVDSGYICFSDYAERCGGLFVDMLFFLSLRNSVVGDIVDRMWQTVIGRFNLGHTASKLLASLPLKCLFFLQIHDRSKNVHCLCHVDGHSTEVVLYIYNSKLC